MNFIIDIIITILIHPFPMLVLRAIKNKPYSPKKARTIAIIDAIIVFVLWFAFYYALTLYYNQYMGTVSISPIIFWGFVSYYILKAGGSNKKEAESNDLENNSVEVSPIFFEAENLSALIEENAESDEDTYIPKH